MSDLNHLTAPAPPSTNLLAPHPNPHPHPNTPSLSPSHSTEASPAFTELISPPLGPVDFELPPAAVDEVEQTKKDKEKEKEKEKETAGWIPECWGHRGASSTFPENTRASFVEAIKAGADGVETDIHITSDNQLVLFHDPELERTTNGTGRIDRQPWYGVLEHVRTTAKPIQPIPKFTEILDLLLLPGNGHVKVNIDCKPNNNPDKLFSLIKAAVESYAGWETKLAPRLILGIWHPKFIAPASYHLPFLPRYAITMSLPQSRQFFFTSCDGFSIMYETLASADGQKFRLECEKAGKKVCAWTVNGREEMRECARWGIEAVISDKPAVWMDIRAEIVADREKALQKTLKTFLLPYIKRKNWWFEYDRLARIETEYLEKEAGPFMVEVDVPEVSLARDVRKV